MATTVEWRSGGATDTGMLRASNEDRYWIDDDAGVFLVVDGVGGHAAGDIAAETAVAVIRRELLNCNGNASACAEERVRQAIAAANNQIYAMARDSVDLHGMACVLTLAVMDASEMVIGHVGDSRLYLIWNGSIRKLTSDHSPVGEGEDAGELTEEEAMAHPRRNEVFRDVGTRPHDADEEEFIEVRRCHFKPEAAFLLCSDGLSDALSSTGIREIVERYQGNPAEVARELVEAANEAGGLDNITALFVAGSEFRGRVAVNRWAALQDRRERHATTRMRVTDDDDPGPLRRYFGGRMAFLLYGLVLGILIGAALDVLKG